MPLRIFITNDMQTVEQADRPMADWSPKLDLRGQTFGNLTAIEPGPRQNGKPAWFCRCEACGTELYVKTKDLRRGATTSCGCQWKKRGVEQMRYVDGTCIEMLQSTKVRRNNTTGYTGVTYDPQSKKYRAEITLQGKRHYIGRYNTVEAAAKARADACKELHQTFIDEYEKTK